jgi:hypothetical protein
MRDALPTMATPLLPPLASSAMSAAEASALRTRAVAAKSHDGGVRHSPSPLPSLSLFSFDGWLSC